MGRQFSEDRAPRRPRPGQTPSGTGSVRDPVDHPLGAVLSGGREPLPPIGGSRGAAGSPSEDVNPFTFAVPTERATAAGAYSTMVPSAYIEYNARLWAETYHSLLPNLAQPASLDFSVRFSQDDLNRSPVIFAALCLICLSVSTLILAPFALLLEAAW